MSHEERLEIIGCIIDCFEDFLEEKGIEIPNKEKEQSDYPANIYGTDYGDLEKYIENTLIRCGLLEAENR